MYTKQKSFKEIQYHNNDVNNWMNDKKSYLITWKEWSGEFHIMQVYAKNEYTAAAICGNRHPSLSIEIVDIQEEK